MEPQREPGVFRWVEAFGGIVVMIVAGGAAYGGINARMDAQASALEVLQALPVQLASFRGEMSQAVAEIRIDQAAKLGELSQRLSASETIAKRNASNLEAIWPRLREMERAQQRRRTD